MLSAVLNNDINLAHNTHLRSLHLSVSFHEDVNPPTWVIILLAKITSPYLVHMTLGFQVDDVSRLNIVDWTGLENVFRRWSNLQELTVYCNGMPEGSPARAFIRAQLPVLESRGIICV
jgi:hypothetical protein